MIHSAETQKLLEALADFVPEEKRAAWGDAAHAFLDSLTADYQDEFMDEAGTNEIEAFAAAADAIAPLTSEMRDRVLRSLRALMLERQPTPLQTFAEALAPMLPELLKHLNTGNIVAEPAGAPVSDKVDPVEADGAFYRNLDVYIADLNTRLMHALVNHPIALVQNEDGSFEFKPKV